MPVRPIEPLKREQQAMIDELRRLTSEAGSPASEPDDAGSAEVYRLARVAQVVSSDSELGPHLKLVLRKWVGRPPASSDGPLPAKTAYPTPKRLSEYLARKMSGGPGDGGRLPEWQVGRKPSPGSHRQ